MNRPYCLIAMTKLISNKAMNKKKICYEDTNKQNKIYYEDNKKCFHHSDALRALNYRNKIINWRNHKQIQIVIKTHV